MGCKFGSEEKEEQKNEIKASVIDTLMEGDNKTNEVHNLDYYQKLEEQELNGEKLDDSSFTNYSKDIFNLINKLRQKPQQYADFIEDSMENIIEFEEADRKKIIFKKQLKVVLNRGEPAFREAARALREIDSLPPFTFKNELCVPLPPSKGEIFNKNYLKSKIGLIRQTTSVDAFFKEMVKAPEISLLLMIVDDNGVNPGQKRTLLLSSELKNIGISSGFIGGTFVSYYAFSR